MQIERPATGAYAQYGNAAEVSSWCTFCLSSLKIIPYRSSASATLRALAAIDETVERHQTEQLKASERIIALLNTPTGTRSTGHLHDFNTGLAHTVRQAQVITICRRVLKTLSFEEINSRQDNIPSAHSTTFEWAFNSRKLNFTEWARKKDGTCISARDFREEDALAYMS